jgi:hypothetical protein
MYAYKYLATMGSPIKIIVARAANNPIPSSYHCHPAGNISKAPILYLTLGGSRELRADAFFQTGEYKSSPFFM